MVNTKHEIIRKAFKISLHGFIYSFRFHPVHFSQVTVEHDPLASDLVNLVLDYLEIVHSGYDCCPMASNGAFGELTIGTDIVCKAR